MSRQRAGGERSMVPSANFGSYYGRAILKQPTWEARDIAGYLFLGGLAGASSTLAAGAELTARPALARVGKLGAAGAISLSLAALVHDLGRPARFVNMLRVFKPTSPMNVGSWLLAGYGPAAGAAAAAAVLGPLPAVRRAPLGSWLPVLGRIATFGAGALGPAVATYTAVLVADTAIPAWHEAYRELPFVFAGSATSAAAGLAVLAAPPDQIGPAQRLAVTGTALELAAVRRLRRRRGTLTPYDEGRASRLLRVGEGLSVAGVLGSLLARRSRAAGMLGGGCLLAASACTRFGIFAAGRQSAADPAATVGPQRTRLDAEQFA